MAAPTFRQIFLSCVTEEFGEHRRMLKADLSLPRVMVQEQADLVQGEGKLLQTLDAYLREHCDAVIHLVGRESGQPVKPDEARWLLATYGDFSARFPFLAEELNALPPTAVGRGSPTPPALTYTQMEAWLALYHGKRCHLYRPSQLDDKAQSLPPDHPQQRHWQRLKDLGEHRGTFDDPQHLCRRVLRDLHDLLPARPWLWGDNPRLSPIAMLAALLTIILLLVGIWWTMVVGFKNRAVRSPMDSVPSVLFDNLAVADDVRRLAGAMEHDALDLAKECENSHLRNLADILHGQPVEFFQFIQTFLETQWQSTSDVLKLIPSDVDRLSSATEKSVVASAQGCESLLIQKLAVAFEKKPSVLLTILQELCK